MDPLPDPSSAGDPQRDSSPAARRPFAFPRERRLTRGADLDRVRRQGRRIRAEHLEVRVSAAKASAEVNAATNAEVTRVGIIVPRHRHSAVDRNRLKRRLRELVRTRLLPALAGAPPTELVVRARAEAYDDTFAALARQIDRVVVNLGGDRAP